MFSFVLLDDLFQRKRHWRKIINRCQSSSRILFIVYSNEFSFDVNESKQEQISTEIRYLISSSECSEQIKKTMFEENKSLFFVARERREKEREREIHLKLEYVRGMLSPFVSI